MGNVIQFISCNDWSAVQSYWGIVQRSLRVEKRNSGKRLCSSCTRRGFLKGLSRFPILGGASHFCKHLATMVIGSPQFLGLWDPFINGRDLWLIHGLTNYFLGGVIPFSPQFLKPLAAGKRTFVSSWCFFSFALCRTKLIVNDYRNIHQRCTCMPAMWLGSKQGLQKNGTTTLVPSHVGKGQLKEVTAWYWCVFWAPIKTIEDPACLHLFFEIGPRISHVKFWDLPLKFNDSPKQIMLGILLSFWDHNFSGGILNFRGCIHIKNASVAKARHQQLQPDVVAATASMDAVVSQAAGKNWARYCWADFLIPVVKLWEALEGDRFVRDWYTRWWQLKYYCWTFSQRKLGKMNPFLRSRFWKIGLVQPPTGINSYWIMVVFCEKSDFFKIITWGAGVSSVSIHAVTDEEEAFFFEKMYLGSFYSLGEFHVAESGW